jgi:hypothetical protein
LERRSGAEYTLAVQLMGLRCLGRIPPSVRGGAAGRVYGWHRLPGFPPACTEAAPLVGGGELSAWAGGRAEYRLRCTGEGDAGLLRGRLEVAVVDDAPAPPDDEGSGGGAGGGRGAGGWEGLCVGTCSVALAALVSRRGVRGQAPLADADGVHCGYVELCIEWLPTRPDPHHAPQEAAPPPAPPPAHAPLPGEEAAERREEPGRRAGGGAAAFMVDDDDGAP